MVRNNHGSTPAVTVVLVFRNAKQYLRRSLRSLAVQSWQQFELVLVDDASTDGSFDIARQEAADAHIIRNTDSLGLTKSLNMAISESSAPLVARMDADDVSLPRRMERQVRFMQSNPDVAACGTWALDVDEKDNYLRRRETPIGSFLQQGHWFPSPIIHPTAVFRRTSEAIYDESLEYAQDFDLWFRLAKVGRLANIPEYHLLYRVHRESITASNAESQACCARQIFRRHVGREPDARDWLPNTPDISPWRRARASFVACREAGFSPTQLLREELTFARAWIARERGRA